MLAPESLIRCNPPDRTRSVVQDDRRVGFLHEEKAGDGDEKTNNRDDPVRPAPSVLLGQSRADERSCTDKATNMSVRAEVH